MISFVILDFSARLDVALYCLLWAFTRVLYRRLPGWVWVIGDLPPTTSASWSSGALRLVVEVQDVLAANAWALVDDES
jgi:hypothetical protein